MKHPALTRVISISLAVLCLVMLLAGGLGVRSSLRERARAQEDQQRLEDRIEEYRLVRQALAGTVSYEKVREVLDRRKEEHDAEAAQHRADVAVYTATRGGLAEGTSALDEAYMAFLAGKQKYEQSLAEFKEKEAAFQEGYAQFQAGKEQLAAGWAQYNTAAAAIASVQAQLSGIYALGDILADETTDDAEALRQASAGAYDVAIMGLDQAIALTESLKAQGGVSTEQLQAMLALLSEKTGVDLSQMPVEGVSAEQLQQVEDAFAAATGMSPAEFRALLQQQRDAVAGGEEELFLSPEAFALVRQSYRDNSGLLQAGLAALSARVGELSAALEPMRAQLETAQAELDSLEPVMEQGKAAIEQGRAALEEAGKQIAAGEAAIMQGYAEIWYQMGKLGDTEQQLQQEKESLDEQADDLSRLGLNAEQIKDLEEQETALRYMLLSREGIMDRVEESGAVLPAAEDYAAWLRESTDYGFRVRMSACVLMGLGALAGLAAIPAAFERRKSRAALLLPGLLCLSLAAAAELLFLHLGRGHSYSALATGGFAVLLLLVGLPRLKKPKPTE